MRPRILAGAVRIAITVAALIVMINIVLPWAGQTLASDFVRHIQTP